MWQPRIKLKIVQIIIPLLLTHLKILPCHPPFNSPSSQRIISGYIQLIINKITMNRAQNNNNLSNANSNPTTANKITRTNPYNQTSTRISSNSKTNVEVSTIELLPNRVSALDSNVIFQDMDRKKERTNPPTNSSSVNQSGVSATKTEEVDKSMGLISNIFLGATSKFVKAPLPSTPTKGGLATQSKEQQEDQPIKLPISKITSRIERQEGQSSERIPQSGRKIERKRQIKFMEKKEPKIEEQRETKIEFAKNDVKDQIKQPQEDFPRVYQQPFQRANPYSRSRVNSQAPKEEELTKPDKSKINEETTSFTEAVVSKPQAKVIKPVANRLVTSRLQTNISEVKSTEQEIVEQSTFSKVQIKLKQQTTKPYSKSFITKKTESQFSKVENSNVRPVSTISVQSSEKSSPIKKEQSQITLKKSISICLIMKRLIQNKLLESLVALKDNRLSVRIKNNNDVLLVSFGVSSIVKHKEMNLLRMGFESIKKKFITPYITSLKTYTDIPNNYRNASIAIFDKLYFSKLRPMFKVLKQFSQTVKNKLSCFASLQTFCKGKIIFNQKVGLQSAKRYSNSRAYKLNQFSGIFAQVTKNKLCLAFIKLAYKQSQSQSALKQQKPIRLIPIKTQLSQVINTTNQLLVDKLQKSKRASSTITEEMQAVKASLLQKRQSSEDEKSSLVQKIAVLKLQNGQANNELQIKKHRNGQIKVEMEKIITSRQPLQADSPQQKSDKFQLLTNLYISNFKNQEELISVKDLTEKEQLRAKDSTLIFREWESILQNVQLKRMIAAYQGVQGRENKGRANLISEQGLVSKLIRSYIKEQYFWSWIHLSAHHI